MDPCFFLYLLLLFFASLALTWAVRRYALRRDLLDLPNERSSHRVPTPRGGGLAIAVAGMLALGFLGIRDVLEATMALALAAGALAALIGWLDDHRDLAPGPRLLVQVLTGLWALWWLGGLPEVDFGFFRLHAGLPGSLIALLGIVWLVNLYNFMDGTDGLAAGQAVTAAGAAGLLLLHRGHEGLALYSLALAAAAAGFLVFNRPPARLFMGDVGSYFLGFTLAVLAIAGERAGALSLWCWLILLAWFLTDATLTLLLRLFRGEPWHQAHRQHAYQRLVQMGWSHGRLLSAFLALQLLVLTPLAALGSLDAGIAFGGFVCAVALCAILWVTIQNRYQRQTQGSQKL